MLKRLNGKVEVRGIDIVGYQSMTNYLVYLVLFFFKLRIVMSRVPVPAPFIDEDVRPHLKVSILDNIRFLLQCHVAGSFTHSSI